MRQNHVNLLPPVLLKPIRVGVLKPIRETAETYPRGMLKPIRETAETYPRQESSEPIPAQRFSALRNPRTIYGVVITRNNMASSQENSAGYPQNRVLFLF
jgi:hypothetical protein